MFGAKKKENNDEIYFKAVCTTVRETLESILKTEYKSPATGVQVVGSDNLVTDYQTTCRMMKTQARIALDLLENIKKTDKK